MGDVNLGERIARWWWCKRIQWTLRMPGVTGVRIAGGSILERHPDDCGARVGKHAHQSARENAGG